MRCLQQRLPRACQCRRRRERSGSQPSLQSKAFFCLCARVNIWCAGSHIWCAGAHIWRAALHFHVLGLAQSSQKFCAKCAVTLASDIKHDNVLCRSIQKTQSITTTKKELACSLDLKQKKRWYSTVLVSQQIWCLRLTYKREHNNISGVTALEKHKA